MSAKAKGKKPKRSGSMVQQIAAKQAVSRASENRNLLAECSSVVFNDKESSFRVELFPKLTSDHLDWCVALLSDNMKQYYESVWGWNEREKRKELIHEASRILLLFDSTDNQPKAFLHFRFEVVDNKIPVLYVYEIQLSMDIRGRGVGRYLMELVEQIARTTKMKQVMLTCFKQNESAMQFYGRALGYELDPSDPSYFPEQFPGGVQYCILSKRIE
eukprot:GILK01001889.1.p2 GENE.GILK01001889.1~~GILK01001889.1.p2  ORF type:complete len:216 (-),score=41.74 GILK01001889.1:884-1531(-)